MCAMSPRLLRPLASGFNPRQIAGLAGWWDAADSSTVTLDSGRVAEWRDKSGNNRHAANSTSGSTQPDYITAGHNGNNLLRFVTASSQRLIVPNPGDFKFLTDGTKSYIAAVISAGATANPNAVYGILGNSNGSNAVGFFLGYDDRSPVNDRLIIVIANGSNPVVGTALNAYNDLLPAQQKTLIEASLDAGNATAGERIAVRSNGGSEVKSNTADQAPSSSAAAQALCFGAARDPATGTIQIPFTGDICEILMYSSAVNAAAQTAIRRYLAKKWGITLA
jgi:hypothetical protein